MPNVIHDIAITQEGVLDQPNQHVRCGDSLSHTYRFALPFSAMDETGARLKLLAPGETVPYMYDCTIQDAYAVCTPNDAAWAKAGEARAQLELTQGAEIVWQSKYFVIRVEWAVDPTGGITPEQGETWYTKLNEAAQGAEDAAAAATAAAAEIQGMEVWEQYNATHTYVPLNKVAYQGSSYINIQASTGIQPTNTEYWLMIAAKGADGTGGSAAETSYDPTASGLEAINVQAAIDEVLGHAGAAADAAAAAQTTADGKASPSITIPSTLLASAWVDGQQTISNAAIKATSPGTLSLAQGVTAEQYNACAACKPHVIAQEAGSITIKAFGTVPTIDIPVYVEVRS